VIRHTQPDVVILAVTHLGQHLARLDGARAAAPWATILLASAQAMVAPTLEP
jgi:hypothetical protein